MPRRRTLLALIIPTLLLTGAVFILRHYRAQPPPWFKPPSPTIPAVAKLAETVEYRLLEEIQKIRPPEESWTLRLREEHLNAWLSVRLPEWIAHEPDLDWPAGLQSIQIHLEPEGLTLAAALSGETVYTVRFLPSIVNEKLHWSINRAAIGQISVGGDPLKLLTDRILPHLEDMIDENARELLDRAEGSAPAALTLDDHRRVIVENIALYAGALDLTCRTTR